MSSSHFSNLLAKRFNYSAKLMDGNNIETLILPRSDLVKIVTFLHKDPDASLDMLMDIFAVRSPLQIFYTFRSLKLGYRLFIRLDIDEDDLWLPTLSHLYQGAASLEREVCD